MPNDKKKSNVAPEPIAEGNLEVGDVKPDEKTEKLETMEVRDVEIFQTGEWKEIEYTDADLDEMCSNFKAGVIAPYVKIGHDEEQPLWDEFALGWVSALRRVGDKLIADFRQVPKKIALLMKAGALKKKSVEVFKTYKSAAGDVYDNVLRAVAFFGGNGEPAVNDLDDIVNLYRNTEARGEGSVLCYTMDDYKPKRRIHMDEITIAKSEYDALVAFKVNAESQIVKFKADIDAGAAVTAELEKMKATNATITKENEVLKHAAEVAEADKKKMLADATIEEAKAFVAKYVKEGKILPKYADMYVDRYIDCKEENDEAGFKTFVAEIEERPAVGATEGEVGEDDEDDMEDMDAEKMKAIQNTKSFDVQKFKSANSAQARKEREQAEAELNNAALAMMKKDTKLSFVDAVQRIISGK